MSERVHWHEGLFLQPHHLQVMSRRLHDRFSGERALGWAHPYGLIEAKLSADALENNLIKFDRLRAIMPSGQDVNYPESADLPALNIKEAFEASSGSLTVSLAVPLWYASRGNTIERGGRDDWRVKRLYRIAEMEHPDENTGENAQAVLVRRINARLVLESDDPSDLEVMPLLRVAHATGEEVGLPVQDTRFVPPCLVLSGSPVLREMLRDLANQVEASRSELVIQMTRAGFSIDAMRGVQFEQMLRLKTLNHYAGRLTHMVQAPSMTPLGMYLELRALLGELTALHPDRDLFEVADYDHDNPNVAFQELVNKIRSLLRGAVAPSFLRVDFVREGNIMVAALSDEHFERPNAYFLGIQTKEDPRTLAKLVEDPDKFKLMSRSLATRRVWGVKLAEERHPPLELPSQTGLHYFRLDRSAREQKWAQIQSEKAIAARWEGIEVSDFALALYMTVPEGD